MDYLHTLLASPALHAAVRGAATAAAVDYHVFLGYHSWNDLKNFDLNTASFRWVIGALTGIGLYYGWS